MFRKSNCLSSILGVAAFCAAQSASGQVLLSNYSAADGLQSLVSFSNWRGVYFTTPASGIDIGAVKLRLTGYTAADNIEVGFFPDSSGLPSPTPVSNGILQDAAPNAAAGTVSDSIFTPSGTLTLAGSTKYWLVVRGETAPTTLSWFQTSPQTLPTGTATSIGFRNYAGGAWSGSDSAALNKLEVTPVPEPMHYSLIAGGALVAFATLRRRFGA